MKDIENTIVSEIILKNKVNENIDIYNGEFNILSNTKTIKCKGNIYYKIHTTTNIVFNGEIYSFYDILNILNLCDKELYIDIPGYEKAEILIEYCGSDGMVNGIISKTLEMKNNSMIDYVNFHIINFDNLHGKAIKNENKYFLGRIKFDIGEYEVTIDKRFDYKEIYTELKYQKGCAVTHIGKIQKKEKLRFQDKGVQIILSDLEYALMFITGRYVTIPKVEGYLSGKIVYEIWRDKKNIPYFKPLIWSRTINNVNNIEEYMELMCKKLCDNYLGKVLKNCIEWYIEANGNSTIENRMVSTQIALETLAYAVLSEGCINKSDKKSFKKRYNESEYASDKIKLLLKRCNIVYGSDMSKMIGEKINLKFQDDAHLITNYRNSITHPRRNNRFDRLSVKDNLNILYTAVSYLELVVLYIIGYSGDYTNRFTCKWYGEVENVPWMIGKQKNK